MCLILITPQQSLEGAERQLRKAMKLMAQAQAELAEASETVTMHVGNMNCPRCSTRIMLRDQDGPFCLPCGWTEPTTLTPQEAAREVGEYRIGVRGHKQTPAQKAERIRIKRELERVGRVNQSRDLQIGWRRR